MSTADTTSALNGRLCIDVTDTARTVNHTGVQRVTRGLHSALLAAGLAPRPLLWSTATQSFRPPGQLEARRVDSFFSTGLHRLRWLARQQQHLEKLRARWGLITPYSDLRQNDWLLLPEIWTGERCQVIPGLACRKVAICHDVITWQYPQWGPAARSEGFAEYLTGLSRMDRVVVPSQETARGLRAFWSEAAVQPAPIEVIPWPLDLPHDGHTTGAAIRGLPEVLCVGTLEKRKNHLLLLEAAEVLWQRGLNFRIVLIGRRVSREPNRAVEQIKHLRAKGRPIVWRERVTDRELARAYKQAVFSVYLSKAEGFGLPVQESLALGCPCLCSSSGAVGELGTGGGCLSPESLEQADEVVRCMELLLNDTDSLRTKLAAEALLRRWPTWPQYVESLLSLIRQNP